MARASRAVVSGSKHRLPKSRYDRTIAVTPEGEGWKDSAVPGIDAVLRFTRADSGPRNHEPD
jgi:hypothetical protein